MNLAARILAGDKLTDGSCTDHDVIGTCAHGLPRPRSRQAGGARSLKLNVKTPGSRWRVGCLTVTLTLFLCRAALGDVSCPGTLSPGVSGGSAPSSEAADCWNEQSARSQARVEEFFALVNAHQVDDAMAILGGSLVATEEDRQGWRMQLNAILSIRVQSIAPALVEDWTATRQIFKLAVAAHVSDAAANEPIPYFGWESGPNIRWVTTELGGQGQWQITAIATGP
jgi:hypothetical protein